MKDFLDAGGELGGVAGEVEARVVVDLLDAAIGKHVVDAVVAGVVGHVVDAGVAEVGQHVGLVQPSHRDLGDAHFQEGGEGREDALLVLIHAEARSGGVVAPFHDPAEDIDVRVGLADRGDAGGAFEVAVEDLDGFVAGLFIELGEDFDHDRAELGAVGDDLIGDAGVLRCAGDLRGAVELFDSGCVALDFKVFHGRVFIEDVVAVGGAFDAGDAGGHEPLADQGDGAVDL